MIKRNTAYSALWMDTSLSIFTRDASGAGTVTISDAYLTSERKYPYVTHVQLASFGRM